jgi:hypothetical protein
MLGLNTALITGLPDFNFPAVINNFLNQYLFLLLCGDRTNEGTKEMSHTASKTILFATLHHKLYESRGHTGSQDNSTCGRSRTPVLGYLCRVRCHTGPLGTCGHRFHLGTVVSRLGNGGSFALSVEPPPCERQAGT